MQSAILCLLGIIIGLVTAFSPGFLLIIFLFLSFLMCLNYYAKKNVSTFLKVLFITGFLVRVIFASLNYCVAIKTGYGSDLQFDAVIYSDHALYIAHLVNNIDFENEALRDSKLDRDMKVSFNEFKGRIPPRGWYQYDDFVRILTVIYSWIGYSPLIIKLFNSLLGCLTAIVIYFFALKLTNVETVAKLASAMIMFYPTLFFWSITGLKDTATILFFVLFIFFIFLYLADKNIIKKIIYISCAMVMVHLVNVIRGKFVPILFIGLILVVILSIIKMLYNRRILFRPIFFLAFLLIFSILITAVFNNSNMQNHLSMGLKQITSRHIAQALDYGAATNYRIFDDSVYSKKYVTSKDLTNISIIKALFKAWLYFFLLPFPWKLDSPNYIFILPQLTFFYICIPLIIIGIYASFLKKTFYTFSIALLLFIIISPIAMSEGIVGIAVRHRDMFTPFWIVFAIYGFYLLFMNKNPQVKNNQYA